VQQDDQLTRSEMPGFRWQRAAAALTARLSPRSWVATASDLLKSRHPAAPARLDQLRDRIRAVRDRPPPLPDHLEQFPQQPAAAADTRGVSPKLPAEEGNGRERQAPPTVLDPDLQRHLERFLRFRLPKIEVQTTALADRVTRRIGADAATADNVVYFRQGAYQPDTPAGMALLAHEATHIAWQQGARPLSPSAQEESTALENERRFLSRRDSVSLVPPPAADRTAPLAAAPAPDRATQVRHDMAPGTPAARASAAAPTFVRAAASARDTAEPQPDPGAGRPTESQLQSLKAELYRTLLDKLRSEFERGA